MDGCVIMHHDLLFVTNILTLQDVIPYFVFILVELFFSEKEIPQAAPFWLSPYASSFCSLLSLTAIFSRVSRPASPAALLGLVSWEISIFHRPQSLSIAPSSILHSPPVSRSTPRAMPRVLGKVRV